MWSVKNPMLHRLYSRKSIYTLGCAALLSTLVIGNYKKVEPHFSFFNAKFFEKVIDDYQKVSENKTVQKAPTVKETKPVRKKIIHVNRTNDLKNYYEKLDFELASVRNGEQPVPAVILKRIPKGFDKISDIKEKKSLFIRTMLPMVLTVNEEIRQERKKLQTLYNKKLKNSTLSVSENKWLEKLAEKYNGDVKNLKDLLTRVDTLPVSLALAQSIEESGWGTSYFVRQGNALFGQVSWSNGMAPRNNPKGVKTKKFPSLVESVRAYMHNLNSHRAYAKLRKLRAKQRATKGGIDGFSLAGTLIKYSEKRSRYIRNLRKIIRKNRLAEFETAKLVNPYHQITRQEKRKAANATDKNT